MTQKRISPTRYAVVGLGHIAQAAVLPAFANARKNSRLTALVSDDPVKLRELSREYGVRHVFSYADYEACLRSGEVDAVYIALRMQPAIVEPLLGPNDEEGLRLLDGVQAREVQVARIDNVNALASKVS